MTCRLCNLKLSGKCRTNTLNSLNGYLEQQKNIYITLCSYCGTIGSISVRAKLPDENKQMLDYNPVRMNMGMEAERLKGQYLLDKQSAAPKLSLTGRMLCTKIFVRGEWWRI